MRSLFMVKCVTAWKGTGDEVSRKEIKLCNNNDFG